MRTLVAIPCNDMMHTDFVRSLVGMGIKGEVQYTFAQGSLVYDSRNQLSDIAIDKGFDRVLWLDSDMVFSSDFFVKMSDDLDKGRDLVSALAFTRKRPIRPVCYKAVYIDSNGVPHADPFDEWGSEIFEIAACGFGAVMCTTDLLKRVRDKFKRPFSPLQGFGEDLSFCLKATDVGGKMFCDPNIKVGHMGLAMFNEAVYMIQKGAGENKSK